MVFLLGSFLIVTGTLSPTFQLMDASGACLRLLESGKDWGETPVSGSARCTPIEKQIATIFTIEQGVFVSISEKMQSRDSGCLTGTGYSYERSPRCLVADSSFVGAIGDPPITYTASSKLNEVSSFYNDCRLNRTAALVEGNSERKTCAAMKKKLSKKISRLAAFLDFHLSDFDVETDAAIPSRDPAHLGVFTQLAVASLAAFPGGEPLARDAMRASLRRTSFLATFDKNFIPVSKKMKLDDFMWSDAQWDSLVSYTNGVSSSDGNTRFEKIIPQLSKVYTSIQKTKRASLSPQVCGHGVSATKLANAKKAWKESQWCSRWLHVSMAATT